MNILQKFNPVRAPDDGGAGGGTGDGTGTGDAAAGGGTPPVDVGKAIQDAMTPILGVVQGLADQVHELKTASAPRQDLEDDTGQDDDMDPDTLSNTEILARVGKMIEGAVKGVSKQVEDTQNSTQAVAAQQEVTRLAGEHKDFWHFKSAIGEQLKTNPQLSIEQAYKLAKVDSPDLVESWDKEQKEKNGESDDPKSRGNQAADVFGGLTATSSVTVPNDKMKAVDAAHKAWDDTFGSDAMMQ